jgi:hypothetical protein
MKLFKQLLKILTKTPQTSPSSKEKPWQDSMREIKDRLSPYMKYRNMKHFCREFLAAHSFVVKNNDDWDVIAPQIELRMEDFNSYCDSEIYSWE